MASLLIIIREQDEVSTSEDTYELLSGVTEEEATEYFRRICRFLQNDIQLNAGRPALRLLVMEEDEQ